MTSLIGCIKICSWPWCGPWVGGIRLKAEEVPKRNFRDGEVT